jgi:hypothetical protein
LLIFDSFLGRVLEAADRILNFAGDLLRLAFGLELGVAGHFARDFLNLAFGLLDGALDSISPLRHVFFRSRYWGNSGHGFLHCTCPLVTQSGHHCMHHL